MNMADENTKLLEILLSEIRQNHIELMDEVTELRLYLDTINWLEVTDALQRALEQKSLDQLIFDAISKGKPLPYLADPTHYGLKDKDE